MQEVHEILTGNKVAPQKLVALFEPYTYLLSLDIDHLVAGLATRTPALSLAEYEEQIHKYRRTAQEIRLNCTDSVRAGRLY